MKGIILAAGMGKRLGKLTENVTKGQVAFGGVSLIIKMLNQIRESGFIEEVIIVTGYQQSNLINHISTQFQGLKITYLENPVYDSTNNIYSLYLAKHILEENDCVIFESDLALGEGVIKRFVSNDHKNSVMLSKYEAWMDGTVVELGKANQILKFIPGKALTYDKKDRYYKTVNVYKFSKEFSVRHYIPFLEAYIKSFGTNCYYEEVLKVISFLEHTDLRGYVLNTDELWYEIDDEHDLYNAEAVLGGEKSKLSNISSRYGGYWRFPDLKDFCYLVNPYYPDNRLIEELKGNFEDLLRQYPSGHKIQSLLAARNFNVDKDKIVVGNGGTELIKAFADNFKGGLNKQKVGIVLPTFEEYWRQFNDDNYIIVPLKNEAPFRYELSDILNFMPSVDILILVNPDNPSGNTLNRKDAIAILDYSLELNLTVLIDESFMDFADDEVHFTLIQNEILDKYPNMFVLKSISKSYGVPGLRLGILSSGNTDALGKVKEQLSIWNINSFAEYYLDISPKYKDVYNNSRKRINLARNVFVENLRQISWINVYPSQANYVLCEILSDNLSSEDLTQTMLIHYNILIKDCAKKLGFEGKNFIRLAVRDEEDNSILINALANIGNGLLD